MTAVGLNRGTRIVLEKPFGRDLASATALNALLRSRFPEEAIFRIDHFLGKEPVQNLLVFRFANALLEPVWDRRSIASVQLIDPPTVIPYRRGSWGPSHADDLVHEHRAWTDCSGGHASKG